MSDDNPWRTLIARRVQGVRAVHVPPVISEKRRVEAWERAVENIERLMRKDGDE